MPKGIKKTSSESGAKASEEVLKAGGTSKTDSFSYDACFTPIVGEQTPEKIALALIKVWGGSHPPHVALRLQDIWEAYTFFLSKVNS